MKRLAMVLAVTVSVFGFAGLARAGYLGGPPTIDGSVAEWEAAGTQYIYADGTLGGEQIGMGKLYMAFDDDNFYLAYKLEDAGPGDDYLYAFDGGFWFPDASAYNSSDPLPSEHILTPSVLELRQSWTGVRGPGAVYGEWYIQIVSNNAKRIVRFGSMTGTGDVNNLTFYAGTYDGWGTGTGFTTTDVDVWGWIETGFSSSDPHFGPFSVTPPIPEPAGLGLIGLALLALKKKRG